MSPNACCVLTERTMSVKIGTTLSNPRPVTGGAVQGSVLGVLDHNVVLNNLDDGLLDIYICLLYTSPSPRDS